MPQFFAKIKFCQRLSETVSKIVLHAPHFSYQAGQYIEVVHEDQTLSPLSIACAPNAENLIEFHLSHGPHNLPALDILKLIQEKNQLLLQGPFGSCTADKINLDRAMIFLAGGTGFAPIKAVLEMLLPKQHCPPIFLYWGAAKESELYLSELPKLWAEQFSQFHFKFALTRPAKEWHGLVGQIPQIVLQDFSDLSPMQVYASGPEALVFAALDLFQQHGLPRELFLSDVVPRTMG